MKTIDQRVSDLEAWAFRTEAELADIRETLNSLRETARGKVGGASLKARMSSMDGKLELILAKLN
ncbi:hypothetical protein AB0D67_38750 [Streptosporangium sp. NPDC048047]|uniref:hypothetical protein n=1 Tax=Streptosporangium sp. NPDC048047 TaxID=3155748 RepID=UPI0034219611